MSYIVPQKMPMRCGLCPCFHAEHPMHCQAVKAHKDKRIIAPYGAPIPDWCPLIDIPTPHGRLGDLDKLKYDIVVGNQKYLGLNAPCLEDVTPIENVDDCIDAIAFAPTVVEAEWRE